MSMKFPMHNFTLTFVLIILLVFVSISFPISLSADLVFHPKYQGIVDNSAGGSYYVQTQYGSTETVGSLGQSNSTDDIYSSTETKVASESQSNGAPSVEPVDKSNLTRKSTAIKCQGSAICVTGVVVNQTLGLSRQERRRLRAMAHRLSKAKSDGTLDQAQAASLTGKLAYLSMLNPEQAEAIRARFHA